MPDPIFLSGPDVPDYFKGVELMTAGMEWQASTGPCTITLEHIADAIVACNEDPHIQPPRIKLGHTSSVNGDHPDHDPFAAIGDAEPAFGVFANLAAVNDGAVLTGDADRVLSWLALSAPATYPNRSSEATWQVEAADFDVQTAGGKRYSMVVTAVSLLGVYIPAISDLEDLSVLITEGPAALAASTSASAAASSSTSLSVSEDEIRQRFNWDWAMNPDNNAAEDTYWWWAREVQVTNGEVIADDDEGHLWQVPFTEKDGVITFDVPQEVRKTYVPMAASGQRVASFTRPVKPSRPAASAASNPAATGRPDPEGGATMDASVREFLEGQGHDPDTATEAQVQAAETYVAAFPATPAANDDTETTDTPETPAGDADVDEPAGEEQTPAADRVPVAASKPDPIAAAQKQAFDSLAAEVASLRAERDAANAEATTKRRDEQVSTALTTGRITPAEREHYRNLLDVDEDRAGALLSALPANRVPLEARAEAPDPEAQVTVDDDGLLPDNVSLLTPGQRAELRARRSA